MKSRGLQSRTRTLRRIKYVVYITVALLVAAFMIYMNFKREQKLQLIQVRRLLVQEQFESDPRFKNITTGIDRSMFVSTVNGTVASDEDFKELNKLISNIRPFPGTYNWRIEVEIKK